METESFIRLRFFVRSIAGNEVFFISNLETLLLLYPIVESQRRGQKKTPPFSEGVSIIVIQYYAYANTSLTLSAASCNKTTD